MVTVCEFVFICGDWGMGDCAVSKLQFYNDKNYMKYLWIYQLQEHDSQMTFGLGLRVRLDTAYFAEN